MACLLALVVHRVSKKEHWHLAVKLCVLQGMMTG